MGKDVDHLNSCAPAYWCLRGIVQDHVICEILEGTVGQEGTMIDNQLGKNLSCTLYRDGCNKRHY